jgi:hypothetical protein
MKRKPKERPPLDGEVIQIRVCKAWVFARVSMQPDDPDYMHCTPVGHKIPLLVGIASKDWRFPGGRKRFELQPAADKAQAFRRFAAVHFIADAEIAVAAARVIAVTPGTTAELFAVRAARVFSEMKERIDRLRVLPEGRP